MTYLETTIKSDYKERTGQRWMLEDLGWHLLPVHSIDNGQCTCGRSCGSPGKHPRTRHGLKDATNDSHQIAAWDRKWPMCSWAVRTGAESGIVVIDVDVHKDGFQSWEQLAGTDSGLETVTAISGSGGRHFYFKHPGRHVSNSVSKLGAGIDVRGDNGYVVLPGSSHLEGCYSWQLGCSPDDVDVAPLPYWLSALI